MYESHLRRPESHTERLVCVLPAQCAARPGVHRWLCARAVAQYPQAPEEEKRPGQRKRSLPMAKYLLLRGGLVLLKTSAHCGTPIFLKANHQLESRMHEICQSGSVGGAKPTLSLPLSPPQKSRPVGYGVIRAGVRTDSMIGVTKFRIRKLNLAGSGNGPVHRAAARTSSDTNLSRRVFSL